MERLDRAFVRQSRAGLSTGVFFVDLDQFKVVNDTYGHRVGDQLLIAVADRLHEVLRPGDTLARVSGDEFVVLCEDLKAPVSAQAIVARLDAALSRSFTVSGIELAISASVGVAFMGEGGAAPEEVLHAADMAMYQAKRAGGGGAELVNLSEQPHAMYQAGLERDVYSLLDRRELHLEYQPIVACGDRRICGVEALLRWDHPDRGAIAPSVLIPLAERTGMIRSIGLWVLRSASADQDRWLHDYSVTDVNIAVNISAHQLMGAGFLDTVASVLANCHSSPERLTLEVTESVFLRDGKRALVVLNQLRAMGVTLALDDFGTGFSSLSYLLEFPVNIVKIDQVFIAGLGRDRANEAIVAAIINLSHDLGLTVIAEGVETASQYEALCGLGSDACQGFYFAPPMLEGSVGQLIAHRGDGDAQHLPVQAAS
jgi:diguanylate cyclase (GGDEF)-like protein